jgi:hypothetical protein
MENRPFALGEGLQIAWNLNGNTKKGIRCNALSAHLPAYSEMGCYATLRLRKFL